MTSLERKSGRLVASFKIRDSISDSDVPVETREHRLGKTTKLVHWAKDGKNWKILSGAEQLCLPHVD